MRKWPFDEVKRLMFVGAHPDDLETIAAGTLYRMIQRGVEVVEVVCTDGQIGTQDPSFTRASLARNRRKETRAAAKLLGLTAVVFLGHRDGELEPSLALRAELSRQYRLYQPDTLMTFEPGVDGHPDHRAAGRAALDAVIPSSMRLYHSRQLRNGVRPAHIERTYLFGGRPRSHQAIYVDVTDLWDLRLKVMRAHACQYGRRDFNFGWLERWMGKQGKAIGVKYAEVFRRL